MGTVSELRQQIAERRARQALCHPWSVAEQLCKLNDTMDKIHRELMDANEHWALIAKYFDEKDI
jgi:hypothetical protein